MLLNRQITISRSCQKGLILRLTGMGLLATVRLNVNDCSTSRTAGRRRSSRRRRGLLSKLNTISIKTHGWQRSWVFLSQPAVAGQNA